VRWPYRQIGAVLFAVIARSAAPVGHTRPVAHLTEGAVLDRRFRLTAPLGPAAAAGTVWRATELSTGADVAVKVLAAYLAGDMVAEARFRLVARTITQLSSPDIARVLDHGQITQAGGFVVPYVLRELAPGQSLAERLETSPLPVEESLRAVATAADALAVAHRAGLVHGRIQPGNVIAGPDRVRITDFGLTSLRTAPAPLPRLPRQRSGVAGRPGELPDGRLSYQAPETAAGGAGSPAADVYAVGVLLVACLAGVQPGTAGGQPLLSAGEAAHLVPDSLAALWAACLAASPQDRPGAAHVAVMVRQALSDITGPVTGPLVLPWAAPGAGASGGAGSGRPAAGAAGWGQRPRLPQSRRSRAVVAATALGVTVAGGAAALAFAPALRPGHLGGTAPAAALGPAVAPGIPASQRPVGSPAAASSAAGPAFPVRGAASPAVPASTGAGAGSGAAAPVTPSPVPTRTALSAIERLSQTVSAGERNGSIRQDVGVDFFNFIRPVEADLASGEPADVPQLVATLRAKVAARLDEQAITVGAAQLITQDLDALQSSSGP
jgi:eukaryotic-like serine/threonine-protein kinase